MEKCWIFRTLHDHVLDQSIKLFSPIYQKLSQNHIKFAATMMENNQLLHDFRYSWSSNDSLDNSKIGLEDFPLSRFEDFPMSIMMLPLIMSTVFVVPLIIFLFSILIFGTSFFDVFTMLLLGSPLLRLAAQDADFGETPIIS